MKAIIVEAPGVLTLDARPTPKRESGNALIRIKRIGLCGTDFHIFGGQHPFLEYPRVIGHELCGEIVEAAPDSIHTVGDPVIVNPYIPCGKCIACRQGKPNCCMNISVFGVHQDGGMCEFLSVPDNQLYAAKGLTLEQGAMVEFLSIGAHAVRRGEISAGKRVLVVGIGPIGIGAALFARLAGADVTILDVNESRLGFAGDRLGFTAQAKAGPDADQLLSNMTQGEFFDVVIDGTSNIKAIEKGFSYVAHGGSYVLISVVPDNITFSDPEFHKREMRLIGSRNATREDFEKVIHHIRQGDIPTNALNTHNFPLEEAPTRIPELMNNQDAVIKAIAHA